MPLFVSAGMQLLMCQPSYTPGYFSAALCSAELQCAVLCCSASQQRANFPNTHELKLPDYKLFSVMTTSAKRSVCVCVCSLWLLPCAKHVLQLQVNV